MVLNWIWKKNHFRSKNHLQKGYGLDGPPYRRSYIHESKVTIWNLFEKCRYFEKFVFCVPADELLPIWNFICTSFLLLKSNAMLALENSRFTSPLRGARWNILEYSNHTLHLQHQYVIYAYVISGSNSKLSWIQEKDMVVVNIIL